ncbi:MAG TPA: sensor histidine kinase, partial [Chitinophagaceae bacterium]|nr:sensor histidine kinase [Chitinophagaceae bacterium]
DIDTAVPLGLIINELFTNFYKYGMPDGGRGMVEINLEQVNPGNFILGFTDNGPGLKDDWENADTLGLKLVHVLSQQLGGKMSYTFKKGSCFSIYFKDTATRKIVE